MPEARKIVSLVGRVRARSLVVGDKPGSCDVCCSIPKVALLGERPTVSGGQEKTRREGLRCTAESNAVEEPVVQGTNFLSAHSLRKEKGSVDSGNVSVPRDPQGEKVKRGFRPHVTRGIWKCVWIALAWKEQQNAESH